MTFDQLKYALELQRTKNFSRAAEACHITQPSLSVQIARLEDELGIVLFDRTRSGVETTEYGKELLKQARLIFDEVARMSQIASELKGEVQGPFRLGVIPTLAPTLLPLFLGRFGKAYPKVRLSILEGPTERLVHEIDVGQLDGAILSTPSKCPESLLEKVLFYEPFVLFASPGHKILMQKTATTDQLSSEEMLLLDDTHCLRDQVLQLCKSRLKQTNRNLHFQSTGLQTLVEYIRQNEGFTLLPGLTRNYLTASERSKNVRVFKSPVPTRKVSLVFHRAHLKRTILEAIKDIVIDNVKDDVYLPGAKANLRVLAPGLQHFEI